MVEGVQVEEIGAVCVLDAGRVRHWNAKTLYLFIYVSIYLTMIFVYLLLPDPMILCFWPDILRAPPQKKQVSALGVRAGDLSAEVTNAAQEAAALREDASAAARRADEARRHLASLEKDVSLLSSQAETLRATKRALGSELTGLRHELDTLRTVSYTHLTLPTICSV